MKIEFIQGDCLEKIKDIPDGSIDLLYSNPPFGITNAKWDRSLDWINLWIEIWRVLKLNGAVVLHSSMPFTFDLVSSQRKYFKYNYVWIKNTHTGFFMAKFQPLRKHEDICVFYRKQPTYNPQMTGNEFHKRRLVKHGGSQEYWGKARYEGKWGKEVDEGGHIGRYPDTMLYFNTTKASSAEEKPATRTKEMIGFFVKTYTDENNTVLDITMNDGLTGVVCKELNRNFIGIELDETYFKIAKERIENVPESLFTPTP